MIYWDGHEALWDSESLAFVVKNLWNLEKPVNVIDYGCGFGFLGAILLPFLPEGSIYTGVDSVKAIIDEAKEIFSGLPYKTSFVQEDTVSYKPNRSHDIAFCQMLNITPVVKKTLKKIKDAVINGGKVICIEADSKTANAAMYFDGLDTSQLNSIGSLEKLIGIDVTNADYLGLRLPGHMRDAGFTDIRYVGSDSGSHQSIERRALYDHDVEHFLRSPTSTGPSKHAAIARLIYAGVDSRDAESLYNRQLKFDGYIRKKINSICADRESVFHILHATV